MTPLALSSGTIAALVVILAVDLFAVIFGLSFRRARRAARVEVGGPGAPVAALRDHEADGVVAIGGGSSLDCAKGINFLLTNGGVMAAEMARSTDARVARR